MVLIKVGSSPTSNVVLNHPSVSPNHLEIVQDDNGAFLLTDLNSLYGTYVNGYRIQGIVQLRTTDMVKAGEVPLPWQSYFMYQAPNLTQQPVVPPVTGIPTQPQYGNPAQPQYGNPQVPPTTSTPYADAFLAPKKPVNKKKVFAIIGGSLLGLLLLVAGLIYWYTRPSYEHLKLIPSNAFVVGSVNFKSLAGKVDVDKMKKLEFFVDMKDKASDKDQSLSKAMGDPMSCGIDIFSQPYAFVCVDKGEYMRFTGGVVFAIKNEGDFRDFVRRLDKEGDGIKMSDNFNYMKLDDGSSVAWNKDGGMFLFSERLDSRRENYCRTLFEQKKEESILSVESFDKFRTASYDLGLFMNYEAMRNLPGVNIPDYLKGSTSIVSISFDEAKLSYAAEFFPAPNATAKIPAILATKGINADLKASIPGNSLGYATMSVDLKALYNYMDKDPIMSGVLDQMSTRMNITKTKLPNLFTGDLFFSFADVRKRPVKTQNFAYDYETEQYNFDTKIDTIVSPTFIFGFSSNDATDVDNMIAMNNPKDTTDGIKYIQPMFMPEYYLSHHGNNYYVTNDWEVAGKLNATGKAGTPLSGKASDLVAAKPMYAYFNMNLSKYPVIVPQYFEEQMGRRDYKDFNTVASIFDYAELQGDGMKQTMDVYLTEKGNCLNTFMSMGNDLYLNHNR